MSAKYLLLSGKSKSGAPPPGGLYNPDISIVSGASSVESPASGIYIANTSEPEGVVFVSVLFTVTLDNSGALAKVLISNPVNPNFTSSNQIFRVSFEIIKTENIDTLNGNAISDGWFNKFYSDVDSQCLGLNFEGSQPSKEYQVSASWKYKITEALERKNANKK